MFDAIPEHTCAPYSTRLGILLRAEDDGFGTELAIDFVDGNEVSKHYSILP